MNGRRWVLVAMIAVLATAGSLLAMPRPSQRQCTHWHGAFGDVWSDLDGDGCDNRSNVLPRDSGMVVQDDAGCTIEAVFRDPYTGELVEGPAGDRPRGVAARRLGLRGGRVVGDPPAPVRQ